MYGIYIKTRKIVNFGCTDGIVPFTNKKDSIQELESNVASWGEKDVWKISDRYLKN